jgi:nucleolar protein 56
MKEEAPNVNAVCGSVIGARLIASAGGLRRLAEFPSSTVQILGAEKALFAHLKKGVKPPKYGVLFQHPAVHSAPFDKRGKIARKIASKTSSAAKIDYFKGEFAGERLAKELEEELKSI